MYVVLCSVSMQTVNSRWESGLFLNLAGWSSWQLVRLITWRSLVQVQPPHLSRKALPLCPAGHAANLAFSPGLRHTTPKAERQGIGVKRQWLNLFTAHYGYWMGVKRFTIHCGQNDMDLCVHVLYGQILQFKVHDFLWSTEFVKSVYRSLWPAILFTTFTTFLWSVKNVFRKNWFTILLWHFVTMEQVSSWLTMAKIKSLSSRFPMVIIWFIRGSRLLSVKAKHVHDSHLSRNHVHTFTMNWPRIFGCAVRP